jgi:pimeloyl-ACP methyl ester carboxylesterase
MFRYMEHLLDGAFTPVPVSTWGSPAARHRALLIHGLGGAAGTWWRVADELARAGFQVIAPDLRGHGAAPATLDYRLGGYVADLVQLGTGWDVVIGQSSGGLLAIHLALADHSFTRRLLLLDPILDVADAAYPMATQAMIEAAEHPADPKSYLAEHPGWHPGDAFALARAVAAVSPFVVAKTLADNQPWHQLQLLDDLTVPTFILGADPGQRPAATAEMLQPYLSANPALRFEVATGCGHAIYRDAPGLVVARGSEHIRDLGG